MWVNEQNEAKDGFWNKLDSRESAIMPIIITDSESEFKKIH